VLVDDRDRVRVGWMRRDDGLPGPIIDRFGNEAHGSFMGDGDLDLGRRDGSGRRSNRGDGR
jgi:hypothetical protein